MTQATRQNIEAALVRDLAHRRLMHDHGSDHACLSDVENVLEELGLFAARSEVEHVMDGLVAAGVCDAGPPKNGEHSIRLASGDDGENTRDDPRTDEQRERWQRLATVADEVLGQLERGGQADVAADRARSVADLARAVETIDHHNLP